MGGWTWLVFVIISISFIDKKPYFAFSLSTQFTLIIYFSHFTVVGYPSLWMNLKLRLTLFWYSPRSFFLWKLCLKNTRYHKNNMIYIIKQEGLYQNKVNSSLVFTCNRKMGDCLNGYQRHNVRGNKAINCLLICTDTQHYSVAQSSCDSGLSSLIGVCTEEVMPPNLPPRFVQIVFVQFLSTLWTKNPTKV